MMDYIYIALISLPIAIIAFNTAYWAGIYKCLCISEIVIVTFAFMLFQAGMFFLGNWTGNSFANSMGWLSIPISEAILLLTGLKLIYSSVNIRPEQKSFDLSNYGELAAVSFASSLNAFMVGLGIGMIRVVADETYPVMVIAVGVFTIGGAYMGKKVGKITIIRIAGILAGISLIGLGAFIAMDLYELI
jgi:putative Mn2+ efflux pump MntP